MPSTEHNALAARITANEAMSRSVVEGTGEHSRSIRA